MPNTTNGLPYPAITDANNPPADFQALAAAVDSTYGRSVTNSGSLPGAGSFAGQRIWVADIKTHAVWSGSSWINEPIQAGGKVPSAAPGVNFTSPVLHTVTFPAGRFSAAPVISFSVSSDGARCTVSHSNVTASGMTVTVQNTTTAAAASFTFHWMATQF
jgi:hypothetical protein